MATPTKRLLLLSNSSKPGQPYLGQWSATIRTFLASSSPSCRSILFVPFATISLPWSEYREKVQGALGPDYRVDSIDEVKDAKSAIGQAEAICIGGGNTFHLLKNLQERDLLASIRERVLAGIPYIGWSAGSNVATLDIGSTNDMPVVWPKSDSALALVPFNINPHYADWKPPNYAGEGRDQRLNECLLVKRKPIVALSEGTGILVDGGGSYRLVQSENPLSDGEVRRCRVWLPGPDKSNPIVVKDVPLDADLKLLLANYV